MLLFNKNVKDLSKKKLPDIYKNFKDNIIKDNDKFIDIVKHITLDCSAEKLLNLIRNGIRIIRRWDINL